MLFVFFFYYFILIFHVNIYSFWLGIRSFVRVDARSKILLFMFWDIGTYETIYRTWVCIILSIVPDGWAQMKWDTGRWRPIVVQLHILNYTNAYTPRWNYYTEYIRRDCFLFYFLPPGFRTNIAFKLNLHTIRLFAVRIHLTRTPWLLNTNNNTIM